MAARPNSGLEFVIDGRKIVFGTLRDVEYGNLLILAVEKAPITGDYAWAVQRVIDDIPLRKEPTLDEKRKAFFNLTLSDANAYLAREFPVGGGGEPANDREWIDREIAGLMFDATTNQIKRK